MSRSLPDIGSDFVIAESSHSDPSGNPGQIAGQNPNRYAIIFANPSSAKDAFVSTIANNTGGGIRIAPGQAPSVLNFEEHGALVQVPWFGNHGTPGGSITVIEIIYQPSR